MVNNAIDLNHISDEDLLKTRFCDLPIQIKNSEIESHLQAFYTELEAKNIHFKPIVYLADEWLCPEDIPAIGIPFYLAHPRLKELEQKMMLEVEGGTAEQFLKLIRHEMGHAVSYAYKFQRKPKWKRLFGHASEEFSDYYRYRKYSKWYVHHLENFYAQSHPDEDWAETFAVWLDPDSNWENRYRNWKAIEKLKYTDRLIRAANGKQVKARPSDKFYNINKLKSRLETHYKKKRRLYAADQPDFYDNELKKIFLETKEEKKHRKASAFLRSNRKFIIQTVAGWTGEKRYVIDSMMRRFIERCMKLGLWCPADESVTLAKLVACITTMIKNYQTTGMFKEHK